MALLPFRKQTAPAPPLPATLPAPRLAAATAHASASVMIDQPSGRNRKLKVCWCFALSDLVAHVPYCIVPDDAFQVVCVACKSQKGQKHIGVQPGLHRRKKGTRREQQKAFYGSTVVSLHDACGLLGGTIGIGERRTVLSLCSVGCPSRDQSPDD